MGAFTQKSRERRGGPAADGRSTESQSGRATLRKADDPTDALRELSNDSPKVRSQIQLQQAFDRSPRVAAQAKLAATLNGPNDATPTRQPGEQDALQSQSASEEPGQLRFASDGGELSTSSPAPAQRKANRTGLPDALKAGVENLSGVSMDGVRVHYNSPAPAQLQARAYTRGSDIHVAPNQERHLPHEAWHVAQQRQGRVKQTLQAYGVPINDSPELESEADAMGDRAQKVGRSLAPTAQPTAHDETQARPAAQLKAGANGTGGTPVVQRFVGFEFQMLNSRIEMEELTGGGALNKWKPIQDGENLEMMTTESLETESDVRKVVTEMTALGRRVRDSYTGEQIDIGNERIIVNRGDDSAQPQVNFDLPLAAMGGGFEQTLGGLIGGGYFDIDNFGYGWSRLKSNEQMTAVYRAVESAGGILTDDVILRAFYGEQSSTLNLGSSHKWPAKLFEDIRGYVVLEFSQRLQIEKKPGLTKDVPLLNKTDFGALRSNIADMISEAEMSASMPETEKVEGMLKKLIPYFESKVGAKLGAWMGTNLYEHAHEPLLSKVEQEEEAEEEELEVGKPKLESEEEEDEEEEEPVKSEETRQGVLIELRRVPVKPINDWVPFALDAFQRVSHLFKPEKGEGEDTSGNEPEDRGGFW